ncbi:MAG: efflux RND transporter permease subunit [Oligoflexia bacterium]|nr:efflux RND transporter permease subunit [Oligoflexia bacterium]
MIASIVRFSIKFRFSVILFTLLVSLLGWYSLRNLPIDAVPDLTNIQVQVNTIVSALTPDEIERTVTVPIEAAVNGVAGVTQVRSLTRFGLSQVTVVFEDDVDIYKARQLVSERLQTVTSSLPKNVQPQLGPVTTGLGEILHYTIDVEKTAIGEEERLKQLMEIRAIQDWHVKPRLLTIKGVAEVNTIGGYEKQIHIRPNIEKMAKFGIHFDDIKEAIEKANRNVGGGPVEQTGEQILVQGNGLFLSFADIQTVPVKRLENFKTISIGDIAEVGIGKELRTGAGLYNGKEAIIGTVLMLMGENSRIISHRVAEQLETIKKGLPEGYKLKVLYNRSDLVQATLGTVEHSLLVGATLVIVVLFLLIGNIRAAIITAIVIPISLLLTFIAMKRFGISANLVSLGALDFGIIVDGTVIVLDNCVRRIQMQANLLKRKLDPAEIKKTIFEATIEIRKSAGFGQIIIVVVFLPIFAFIGIEGKMFKPMAATFIFAILSATILSFSFIPALASLLLKGDTKDHEPFLMRKFQKLYTPILNLGLKFRAIVLTFAVISVILGGILFSRLGGEFLPQLSEGSLVIQFIRPVNAGLSHSVALEERAHKVLLRFPEIEHVFGRIGTAEIATDAMGVNVSDAYVMLRSNKEWPLINGKRRTKDILIQDITKELKAELPGQRLMISQPIQLRFNELVEGTRANVSLKIYGEDQKIITEYAQKIADVIKVIPGAGDVEVEAKGSVSVLGIRPNGHELQKLGVSSSEVLDAIEKAIGGEEVGVFYENMRPIPIIVRLSENDRSDLDKINHLPIGIDGETTVPLKELAQVHFKPSFSSYTREQTKRRIAVLINPRERDTASFVNEAMVKVEKEIKLPPGYYLEWGGNFKNLQEAQSRLMVLGPVALLLVAVMVFFAFKNVAQTGLIFICIPLALIGGVLGLMIKGLPFSISAGVGFIALSGIAVLNGVVLVNYFNDLREQGLKGEALVKEGTALRLRPVLMTALVDIFGFIPMALSTGVGSEVQKPLACVVIGGIISSTILTLIVLPVLSLVFESRLYNRKSKLVPQPASFFT